ISAEMRRVGRLRRIDRVTGATTRGGVRRDEGRRGLPGGPREVLANRARRLAGPGVPGRRRAAALEKRSLARQRGAALSSLSREGARLGLMSAGVIAPLPRSRSRFRPVPAQGVEGIQMEWDEIVARK